MARTFVQGSSDKISYGHQSFLDGATRVAISLWIYPSSTTDYTTFLSQLGAAGTGTGSAAGISLLHDVGNNTLYLAFRGSGATGAEFTYSGGALTANTWQHLLIQYDGTQGTAANRVAVYVNNSPLTAAGPSSKTAATAIGTNNQPLLLGAQSDSTLYWSGRMADVAIWTGVVLGSTERAALTAGKPANGVDDASLLALIGNLEFYAPLDSSYTAGVNDIIIPATGTLTGTSTVAHPSGVPTSDPAGGGGGGGGSTAAQTVWWWNF